MTTPLDWSHVGPQLLALVTEMERMMRGPSYLMMEDQVIASLNMGDSWSERARAAIAAAKKEIGG